MKTGSTWMPFESNEVREIVQHMRAEEKVRYAQWVGSYRSRFVVVSITSLVFASFAFDLSEGLGLPIGLLIFAVVEALLLRWTFRRLDQLRRGLLCSTEYAATQGYSVAKLRLWCYPWCG